MGGPDWAEGVMEMGWTGDAQEGRGGRGRGEASEHVRVGGALDAGAAHRMLLISADKMS